MAKMWAGRTDGAVNSLADDFNSSISFDKKMVLRDLKTDKREYIQFPQMKCYVDFIL